MTEAHDAKMLEQIAANFSAPHRRNVALKGLALSMSQKDAQVAKAKELHGAIQQMTEKTEALEAELKALAEEKTQIERDLNVCASRAQALQAQLPQKARYCFSLFFACLSPPIFLRVQHAWEAMELKQLEQLEQQKEAEYMKMLEATPTLVQVLKK